MSALPKMKTAQATIGPAWRMPGVVYPPEADLRRYVEAGYLGHDTLPEAFMRAHAAHADRPALVGPEGTVTHREFDELTDRAAAAFLNLGLEPLDRVVFQVTNCKEMMVGLFACFKAGLIPICTLVSHREREIGYLANHARARLHFVQGDDAKFDHVQFARRMQKDIGSLRHIVCARGPARDGALSLRDLIAKEDPVAARAKVASIPRDPFQVLIFQLSGGTTGVPKIIPRFSGDYLYNMRAVSDWHGYNEMDVMYNPMPIMHNYNMVCCSGPVLLAGGAVALAPTLDPDTMSGVLREQRPTWAVLGGPLLAKVAPAIARGEIDFSRMRGVLATSGGPKIRAMTGVPGYHVFGMTEGVIMFTRKGDAPEVLDATCGRPVSPLDHVKILRPGTEEELPLGEVGESAFTGPYTIRGYYDAAERNAEAFTSDGYYRSGDLMSVKVVDGKQYFVFQGRIKDVVDRAGEKINAEEVEWAVATHPAVAACAVIGAKDKVYGERVCACIVLKPGQGAPDVASLGEHLRQYGLAKFKWPERIEIVTELPVTQVGKLDKNALRAKYAAAPATK
jgi:non-ribosomal peptide synthetase component E (peptide arylation enzyme)